MKTKWLLTFIAAVVVSQSPDPATAKNAVPKSSQLKPRIVVMTDLSFGETDDSESLVRLLVHADLFEIEGLIYSTGYNFSEAKDKNFTELLMNVIDAYEKDLPNLMKRSGQQGFMANEDRQPIGYWPSAGYLRSRAMFGSKKRGAEFIGKDNDSPGSELMIKLAGEDDPRPVWVALWGGGNTLVQAIWKVQQERSSGQVKTFVGKFPVYAITDQDRGGSKAPLEGTAQQLMLREHYKDMLYIWDESAWRSHNRMGRDNWPKYAAEIQGKGNLGDKYPTYRYGVEGDTPSILYLTPNGLSDPMVPGQGSWGGYFVLGTTPLGNSQAYMNHTGRENSISSKYQTYFYPAAFNNFAARMEWAQDGEGNRNPVVVVNNKKGLDAIKIAPRTGREITLDASKSYDPDGDQLNFKWWVIEAGTYPGEVAIADAQSPRARIVVPTDAAGKSIHVICEVTDSGQPTLTSYRRVIIEPAK